MPIADQLPLLWPELILGLGAMGLLLLGVFNGEGSARNVTLGAVATLLAALAVVVFAPPKTAQAFGGMFVTNDFVLFAKALVLAGSAATLVLALRFNAAEAIERFEFPILFLLSTLGMLLMISAGDLIALYLGLELSSLALYVLAAYRRDSARSAEAGLKYFVLGALASGLLVYGASLLYGISGTTSFAGVGRAINAAPGSLGALVGLVFLAAGFAFKLSLVPFHMWTPDVYEGAPTPVTAFFAIAPKIAALTLLTRVLQGPLFGLIDIWQQLFGVLALASMAFGAFAAIAQSNIKRLMAYSSIGHMGYALVGVAAGGASGVQGVLLYLTIYLVMNLGTFACILAMRRDGRMVEEMSDLAGLNRTHPGLAMALAIFMFSLAGLPPLAGFFGKLYVFLAAVEAGFVGLAIAGLLSSVVAAYYYMRVVKVMYFDEPADAFDRPFGRVTTSILGATAVATVFFFLVLSPVLDSALRAAKSLFAA